MDTLAFGYILPATGRIRDFHPLERALAEHTKKQAAHLRFKLMHGLLSALFLNCFTDDFTNRSRNAAVYL